VIEETSTAVSRGARLASLLGNNSTDRKSQLKGQDENGNKAAIMKSLKVASGSAIKAYENSAR